MSALNAAKILIVLPAVGADLAVSAVEVWLPDDAKLLTSAAHCVAVTVPATEAEVNAPCPQPLSPDPVAQISFNPPGVVVNVL
jgi:hypothetical protein